MDISAIFQSDYISTQVLSMLSVLFRKIIRRAVPHEVGFAGPLFEKSVTGEAEAWSIYSSARLI